jgi:hypothetical protein
MLLLLLSFIFILVPSLNLGRGGEILIKSIYSLILLTGILSVARHKKFVIIVSVFAVIAFFLNWLSEIEPTVPVLIANDLALIFFNLFFAVGNPDQDISARRDYLSPDRRFYRSVFINGLIFAYYFMLFISLQA